jgi:DNA-directed RNA polymerase subunit RPC12/RpoP
MELFTLTCTTCKSRLKVRDQAAIGQILACPKCGGMVMIKPPPAWDSVSEDKSDLPTATELVAPDPRFDQTLDSSAFDVVEELLSDSPPKVQPPVSETPPPAPSATPTPKPRFVGGPPVVRSSAPGAGTAPKASATPSGFVVPPPLPAGLAAAAAGLNGRGASVANHEAAALAPPPPAETDPAHARSKPAIESGRRYWLWMAGSVALGVVLAFAAVAAALYAFGGPRHATGNIAKGPVAVEKNPAATAPVQSPPESPDPELATRPAQPDPQAVIAPDAVSSAKNAATAATNSDPLALDKQPAGKAPPSVASSDPLAKFDRLVGGASDDPLAKTTDSGVKSSPPPPPDPIPSRPLAPRPPPRDVDVARRLADPLPGIDTSGTPLADFVQLMSDLSTIPITLELPFLPATAESEVVLRLTNTTVGKAIDEAIGRLRLQSIVVDDQLVIRRSEPEKINPVRHPVKDLTGGDEQQMTELAELLKAVVEPTAWGEGEGAGSITADAASGTLEIKQRRSVQFEVLTAIEKLRRARTPALPKVSQLDAAAFALETRWTRVKPLLEKTVSLNYSQPTRLLTILERLGQAAGVRIVVDWRDVASAGWNPSGEASLVVSSQPLAAALDALLNPLDLTWRIIDAQTLQVVTPARLVEQGELEVYKIGDLALDPASGEALLAKIRAALGEGIFEGGSSEIRYEEDGKCLLAWLSQPKQRELEALLAKWQSEKVK